MTAAQLTQEINNLSVVILNSENEDMKIRIAYSKKLQKLQKQLVHAQVMERFGFFYGYAENGKVWTKDGWVRVEMVASISVKTGAWKVAKQVA